MNLLYGKKVLLIKHNVIACLTNYFDFGDNFTSGIFLLNYFINIKYVFGNMHLVRANSENYYNIQLTRY